MSFFEFINTFYNNKLGDIKIVVKMYLIKEK